MKVGKDRGNALRTLLCVLAPIVGAVAFSGCWPFGNRGPTPQQQYLDALNHGHSAEASQIWLKMSPEDRQKWARSEGVSPQTSRDEIKQRVIQHYEGEAGSEQEGNSGVTQIAPLGGAGLQNLPTLASPTNNPAPPPGAD
jgi:hypothetical protein